MALTKVPSNLDATVATTQSASDNSTNVATTAYVTTAISNLVDGAPSTLNTLNEIAAALNDDAALNTTLTNSIATKLPLAGGTLTGALTGTSAAFNNGASNIVATFTSTDSLGGIGLADNGGSVELVANGNDFEVRNAGGTAKMFVKNSGYAGFAGAADVRLALGSQGTAGNNDSNWIRGESAYLAFNSASDGFKFEINGSEKIRVDSSGNVGIGAIGPSSKLHVDGSYDGPLVTIHQTGGASGNYSGLLVETSSTGTSIAQFKNSGTLYGRFSGTGKLVLENKHGTANSPNLEIINPSSVQFNHSVEISCPNLGSGENNGLFIGKAMSSKNTGYLGYRWDSNNSNSNYIHLSHWASDYLFRVYGNGDYYFAGSNISDRDLKEDIKEVPGTSLDKIINLPIKSFKMKKVDDYSTELRHQKTGFIAQEVQEVLPDVVTGTDGQKDMGIDPTGIIAHLVRAMKELKDENDALKTRIENLES